MSGNLTATNMVEPPTEPMRSPAGHVVHELECIIAVRAMPERNTLVPAMDKGMWYAHVSTPNPHGYWAPPATRDENCF